MIFRLVARPALLLALPLLLSACVYLPRVTSVYDEECQIVSKQMVLEAQVLGDLRHCGRDCYAVLVATGVVAAASAVVSGSIVVAGNVVYWFEKQGRCRRAD